ncbi:MAG: NAD(+)/NADH kinase [Negativicutes bacterium]|nr:NAD(+)/NADH kinase [Negativicutes bacterium]
MLTIGLFPNTKKPAITTVLGRLVQHCKDRGVKIFIPEDAARETGYPELACDREQIKQEIQLAITLGGDGTLLYTAREIAAAGIPVCGINLGRLGFLTEVEVPELEPAVDKLINGDYYIEERLMLATVIQRAGREISLPHALNDVVITKGGISRMIRLKLYLDGELTAKYPADGLIVATSTGSTGYSLSAGGPVVNPNLKVILLTPICPHTLDARSLIVSEQEEIKITMQATHDDIVLTIDGQNVHDLTPDDTIIVRRSPYRARFVRLSGRSYSHTFRTKLWRSDDNDDDDSC